MKMHKKGFSINAIPGIAVSLGVAGLIIAFVLELLGDTQDDMTADSLEFNASADAMEGVAKLGSKLPLIAGVAVIVIVIGLLVTYFMRKMD